MTQAQVYNFKGFKYYVTQHGSTSQIYDGKRNRLSKKDILSLGFESQIQMASFIQKASSKKTKAYYDTALFIETLTDNFLVEGYAPTPTLCKELIKGINYSIIPVSDKEKMFGILQKIRIQNNSLVFRKLSISYDQITRKALEVVKFAGGTHDKKCKTVSIIPLFYERVLNAL